MAVFDTPSSREARPPCHRAVRRPASPFGRARAGFATNTSSAPTGPRAEVFLGAGGAIADEGVATFDVGATAWLTDRWGLGAWNTFAYLPGESGGGVLFNPAVRYQRRLRRGRYIHFGVGPGYVDSNAGTVAAAVWHPGGSARLPRTATRRCARLHDGLTVVEAGDPVGAAPPRFPRRVAPNG